MAEPKKPAKKKPAAKRRAVKKPAAKKPAAGKRAAAKAARDAAAKRAKRAAEKKAALAEAANAKGARLPAAQMGLRNSLIVARRQQGVEWSLIAAEAGVSVRTAQRAFEQAVEVASPLDERPMTLLENLARGYLRSIADYEGMAFAWHQVNQPAALGAKKAADETRARLATLMADVGKLPENLELYRSEMEMRRIAGEMIEVLEAVVAGERPVEDALRVFGQVLAAERGQEALPASTSA